MLRLVKIKFRPAGRHYDFDAQGFDLSAEERVVVETDRGRALGTVVAPPREVPRGEAPEDLKTVLRPASADDLLLASTNSAREGEAFRFCRKRIEERKMEMKLVRAEYLFDGSKIIFFFTADGRIDFRELVKDLAHHFHTRIEMRQIGVRDEAKLIGGIGICGRELCCCSFLSEFAPVSVKMAKEQGLALNPTKISGQCGRLLCCLAYEFETYCALKKGLPKCGRKVQLDGREGEVIDVSILRQHATVRFEDGGKIQVNTEQLEKGSLGNVAQPAPASPRSAGGGRREGGQDRGRNRGERPQTQGRPPAAAPVSPQVKPQAAEAKAPRPAPPPAAVQPPAAETVESAEGRRRRRNRRRGKRKPTTSGE